MDHDSEFNEVGVISMGDVPGATGHTVANPLQPNALDEDRLPLLLRKKRHMSGLMCPPMGVVRTQEHIASK